MSLSKNTYQGLLGITTLFSSGIKSVEEGNLRSIPNIISTSNSTTSDTITLGTVNAGNKIIIFAEKAAQFTSEPSGFEIEALSNPITGSPRLAIFSKTATGSETTITGDWNAAVSMVIDGSVSVIGVPQGPTASGTSTAPSINVSYNSLVAFLTVNDGNGGLNNYNVITPPSGWTELEKTDDPFQVNDVYVYTKSYLDDTSTGNVTAVWSGSSTNSVLISFTK